MVKFLFRISKIFLLFYVLSALLPSSGATLEEMTGQMIMTGFHGKNTSSPQYKKTLLQIEKGEIGGVIIFEHNFDNPDELEALTNELNSTLSRHKPFIAVDQEGGIVQILNSKKGFKDYKTAKAVSKISEKEAYESYFDMAKTLRKYGFNINFAPCVDLNINKNSIINKKERSYSQNPEIVVEYAKIFINSHYDNGIITSLKHFPGHGGIASDTHLGFSDASDSWKEEELIPYQKLSTENNLQTIMISHIFIKSLDEKYPSSLSQNIIGKKLREEIGFKGVVVTDDLHMGAIRNNYSLEEVVISAINGGCDILLFSNYDYPDMKTPYKIQKIVKQAIKEGKILPETIENSYKRIILLKKNLNKKQSEIHDKNLDYTALAKKYEGKTPLEWGENTTGVIHKIKTKEKIVALTFDACGSNGDNLDENLISYLEKEKIPATFFINKRWIKKYPEKFERLYKNPLFEIENHGANHTPASISGKSIYNIKGTRNSQELIEEIDDNGKLIEKITGRKPLFYRSGTAFYDEYAIKIANELGYEVMGFSILGDRGATYSARQVKRALLSAKAGDILIFHINHPEKETGKGLLAGLPEMKLKGFRFVKLEDYKNLLY